MRAEAAKPFSPSAMYNNGESMTTPQESCANGCGQRGTEAARQSRDSTECKAEEEPKKMEAGLAKKANREILDHERKRRVELKCMELHEMMEEQGYTPEEICQKVGAFRQMLMEKEGVLTREDSHGHNVLKRKSSSSASPPPRKKKKKKSGHYKSRKKRKPGCERSCDSSSPSRKERRKKSGKKHKRDRSDSGSRKKRRHRSTTPKTRRREKKKQRKRSRSESPARKFHRGRSCGRSRSLSVSSVASTYKSLSSCRSPPSERRAAHGRSKRHGAVSRQNPKKDANGRKPCCPRSSASASQSPPPATRGRSETLRQNGYKAPAWNGRHGSPRHGRPPDKSQDVCSLFPLNSVSLSFSLSFEFDAKCYWPFGLSAVAEF
ncbi:serine/arginine repetitive matrix protein 3 [Callorhinchus milii]|uniref:serine/arginine repetitive matrix protein 3 n=1 Tax=Callorhinchus milii TaxID=7868 RepID=UPI001C3FC0D6|nr:serine/arginine repetitive matrix protein 3 [Callorhinchus milii]